MQIYYINLGSRPDRRNSMEKQFEQLGLTAQRVEAVTPAGLSQQDVENYSNPKRYFWLTPAELACSYSHISAMKKLVESNASFCLIFEDDVLISNRLKLFIEAFEKKPPEMDILRLESSEYSLRLAPKPDSTHGEFQFFRFFSWCEGTAGYIVSRKAAQSIIASEEMKIRQTDVAMFNPYHPLAKELTVLQILPALCHQRGSMATDREVQFAGSDIHQSRLQRASMSKAFPLHHIRNRFLEFVDRDLRMGPLKIWHQTVKGAKKRAVPFKMD